MTEVNAAEIKLTMNVNSYALRARGVHTAAQNAAGPKPVTFTMHAAKGITSNTPKYTSVIPSDRRNPGNVRFTRVSPWPMGRLN